jgi:hypothetical protein
MSTDKRVLSGSLALTKLKSAFYTTKKGAKCLMIPLEENHLTEKDGAVYMAINAIVRNDEDQYGQHGFIAQKLSTEKYKALGKEEANKIELPILGNLKDFNFSNTDSISVHDAEIVEGSNEDDLPF